MFLEYVTGFEPVNNGFADRPFRPLRHTYINKKSNRTTSLRLKNFGFTKIALPLETLNHPNSTPIQLRNGLLPKGSRALV